METRELPRLHALVKSPVNGSNGYGAIKTNMRGNAMVVAQPVRRAGFPTGASGYNEMIVRQRLCGLNDKGIIVYPFQIDSMGAT